MNTGFNGSDCNGSLLALALAMLMASTVSAAQVDEQAGANEAGQEVVEEADSTTDAPPAPPEPEAVPVEAESADGETDPPPEPQAVVKTKTKSNQSND